MKRRNFLLLAVALTMGVIPLQAQNVYYVDAGVASSGDGLAWTEAFKTLEEAVAQTTASSTDIILVKKGLYTAPATDGLGYFFDQKKSVTIYGNCEGTESLHNLPIVNESTAIETILKAPVDDDNMYLARIATIYKGSVTMIGFDMEGGDGAFDTTYGQGKYAGAIFIQGKGVLKYCKIHGATALSGGGLQIKPQGTDLPLLEYCEIYENTASNTVNNTGGGGLYISGNALIMNCTIRNNNAHYSGGGIYLYAGDDALVSNCVIKNNTAQRTGGIVLTKGNIVNCLIEENVASEQSGGGVAMSAGTLLINSTVVNNEVTSNQHAGGIVVGAGIVKNCIVWGNTINNGATSADIRLTSHNTNGANVSSVLNSCYATSNGPTGSHAYQPVLANNIDSDPLFTSASDFTLQPSSLCKNAGDNNAYDTNLYPSTDLNGNVRIISTIDMGAYETGDASTNIPDLLSNPNAIYSFTKGLLTINYQGHVSIYDTFGKLYAVKSITGTTDFLLPSGLYIINVGGEVQKAIVK